MKFEYKGRDWKKWAGDIDENVMKDASRYHT
jgi:hypothetical protein